MYIYGQENVYMATYRYIYPYIQYIHTQMVHTMTCRCIYSQEADVHYTKLTQLWCNDTQLPHGGLHHQPSHKVPAQHTCADWTGAAAATAALQNHTDHL